MIQSAGAVQLTATAQPTATALSVAASLSLALAPTSFSFAGGGASSTNQIDNDVESHILGAGAASPSTVVAGGAVNLSATETGSVDATVGSGAVTFGLVGASVGVSLSQNTIDSTIEAEIDNAQVTGGSIQVEATATDMVQPTKTIATSVAISLGGAGAGGDASATVSPTVQAVVGGGAILNTPGDLSITSSSNSTAAAQNTGVAGGLIAVGDSKAEATIGGETLSTVVAGALLTAGGNLSVTATSTQSANASATADAGGIGVGADATATVMVNPTVQAVVGDETGANTAQTTLTAGKSIMVSSSETTTEANATSTNNAGGGIVGGTPTSTTTVNDSSNAALGGNVVATVALGNFTLSALAEDDGVKSEADASGGGVDDFANSTATTNLTDPATAVVGAGSSISAPLGTLLVKAQTGTDANAVATANGGGVGVNSTSTANTTVDSVAESHIDQNAKLSGVNVDVVAQGGQQRSAQANATSTSKALGVMTTATTVLKPTYTSTVAVDSGAALFAPGQVQLSADTGADTLDSVATGNSGGLAGNTTTSATNSGSIAANVTTASGSTITASTLSVSANTPTPSIDTNDPRNLSEAGDTGSASESLASALAFSDNIQFNSTVTIVAASPQLVIGPSGTAITQSGVTFENSDGQISVDDIKNTTSGSASLAATGQGTNEISGTATFNYTGSYAAANIVNESDENLVIKNIQVLNPNVVTSLSVTPGIAQNFHYMTNVLTTPVATAISILNTGASNIVLAGVIQNPLGSTSISDTGDGSIISANALQSVQTGQLTLNSATGSLGTSSNPLNIQLVQSATESPSLQATAPLGNVYLNVAALNQTTDPLVVTGSALTGNMVNLQIEDGASQTAGQTSTTPQASTYNLSGVAATQQLDVDAGTSTAVTVAITAERRSERRHSQVGRG